MIAGRRKPATPRIALVAALLALLGAAVLYRGQVAFSEAGLAGIGDHYISTGLLDER